MTGRSTARHITRAAATLLALALLAAACGESGPVPPMGGDQSLFDRAPDERIAVALSEFQFDPPTLQLRAGALTELAIENRGGIEHDFSIRRIEGSQAYRIDGEPPAVDRRDDQDVHMPLSAGGSGALRIVATEPGDYELYCSVSGHRRAGMRTTLTVR